MILNHIAKILSVGRAATRIWIKHHVTFRSHPLKFVLEDVTVSRMGPTMDIQNKRIFFPGIKVRRFLHPCLDAFAIESLIRNLFRLGKIKFGEKLVVNVRSEEHTSELQ